MGLLVCVGLVSLLFAVGVAGGAVSGRVISAKNEYGGKTVEQVYTYKELKKTKKSGSMKDMVQKDKIQKDITYFDGKGKKVKMESYYSPQYTATSGAERRIAYFDANGELTKMEKVFTVQYSAGKGYDRMITYYDMKKKQTRTEYYKDSKLIKTPK